MTKRDARQLGREIAESINIDGEFSEKELSSRDSFIEACWEIADNRRQYAGGVEEDFRRDSEWDGFDEGLGIGFEKAADKRRLY